MLSKKANIMNMLVTGTKCFIGILLCGLGGMGKTCLANSVCYGLRSDHWHTTKVELRYEYVFKSLIHVLRKN